MKAIEVRGPYGELELSLAPGEPVLVTAKGPFAIIDLKLRQWSHAEDPEALLIIERGDRLSTPECAVKLTQLAKRGIFPLQLFFQSPTLQFSTMSAAMPILLQIHHEAIEP